MTDLYENPLITRYASKEMSKNFSSDKRFTLWRKLWIALAEAEKELGLNITDEQIDEMKKYVSDINYDVAAAYEKEVRHDVMAHVKAFGDQAKSAKGIIHLGATSCYVTDNADILIIKDAIDLVQTKLLNVINNLKNFALKYKDTPTLGYTHLQPAQLTTVGKRACLWIQDLLTDYDALMFLKNNIKLRGVKGTTGTQASFMELFGGDEEKVKQLENIVVKKFGMEKAYAVTGQTYPRKFDYSVLSLLSSIAQSCYKFANDIRVLQSFKEMEEPFEKNQIGSSAMAYKRNPMRTERLCSLARFIMSAPMNAAFTSSTQWFERTLDDSANRRIVIAQAFLATDAALKIYMNVSENLVVYEKVIEKRVKDELPFMVTENIIMEGVKAGGDRQELHEKIRVLSMQAAKSVKEQGKENDLMERIINDPAFSAVMEDVKTALDPNKYIGRAPSQVVEFINAEVDKVLNENKDRLGLESELTI